MCIGVMRRECNGTALRRCAVIEAPAMMQGRAEIGPGIGKVGPQCDSATVSFDCVIEFSQRMRSIAEIAVGFSKIRLGRDGLAVSDSGFTKLLHLVERDTKIA